MNAKDVIKQTMQFSHMTTEAYLGDLSDEDLLSRPVKGMNHIAWQLGHLICSEQKMISGLGHAMPELPTDFEEAHQTDNSKCDDASKFGTKEQYLSLMAKMREATLAALGATPDGDLDKPGPEGMKSIAATVGAVFGLVGNHEMMHAGQWVAVRRKLDKPIAI